MRVVITGMGVLSSLGNDVDTMFTSLCEGKTGVKRFDEWKQYKGLNCFLGAPVPSYDISPLPRTVRRAMSRMSEMGALATIQALNQAGLTPGEAPLNSPRTLLIMGSTSGSPDTLEAYFKKLFERGGPEGQVSTSFFKVMNHSVAANVAAAIGFNGGLLSPSSACSTSTQAIITGSELIRAGLYDVVIAGGADELHYMSAAIFDIVHAASRGYNDRPELAPRPFSSDRDGLVVSEGAGVIVMESEQHARKRNAKPLAEVRGGAYFCDSTHMTQSSATAMVDVMRFALQRSDLTPSDIDYVNAHATGTIQGDTEEVKAIAEVFGDRTPVSGIKGHLGHSLAACGAIEAITCVKMMEKGVLIPTKNLDSIDPACASVKHIREVQPAKINACLSNNFAFGGMNTTLLVAKC